jgi:biopolymer transport protein ExbD
VIDAATMIDFIRTDANKDPQPEVHLRANSRVRYEYVAYVLFALQRNGLKKIGFLTGDPSAAPAG